LVYWQVPGSEKVFSSLHIYFDVNNVFVFTPYKGLDPETDALCSCLSECKNLYYSD
jgi:hypothetical protein